MMEYLSTGGMDAQRKIAVGLRTGWLALATFLGLVAVAVALGIAFARAMTVADDLAHDDERQLVTRYLARTMQSRVGTEMGIINWDDAISHVTAAAYGGRDLDWIDREYGRYAFVTYNSPQSFIVRGDGSLVRAWNAGNPVDDVPYRPVHRAVVKLIAASALPGHTTGLETGMVRLADGTLWPIDRTGMPLPRWSGGLVWAQGQIEVIIVASIVPDKVVGLFTRAPTYFVTLYPLDEAATAVMRNDLRLDDVGITVHQPPAPRDNAIALNSVEGQRLGWLRWVPKSPGHTIMRRGTPIIALLVALSLGVLIGWAVVLRRILRITRELIASEAQARHNALHDAMSGLANRAHLMQRMARELAMCQADPLRGDVFVAYIDLDGFKLVNDTLGHHIGDELVRQVAWRLQRTLAADDFIARIGGDEFVVVRRAHGGEATAEQLGSELVALFRETFAISGHVINMSCSCGISWGPEHAAEPSELLRLADIALYRAKKTGRARYRCFSDSMDASIKQRQELEMDLRHAIARNELWIAYQPIVDATSGQITGVEALLRWNHQDHGAIGPDLFVPIAERGGLMIGLGTWMLEHVFNECRAWPACDVSVNLSPVQIMAGDFIETLAKLVAQTGIDPARVVLEITEGLMLERSDHVVGVLRELGRMGFRIALDDFGTGYSSLAYLRMFQFDRIKIDKSFVSNIAEDRDANAILLAVVALGRSLRMKVVAEGVETETQRRMVKAAGCELIQGFLFWKPMTADAVRELLEFRRAPYALKTA